MLFAVPAIVVIVYLSWKMVLAAGAVGLATGWSIFKWFN